MQHSRLWALGVALLFAAGCGGGGSTGAAMLPSSPGAAPQVLSVSFHIVIPAAVPASRGPKYVSASTQSASITVTPQGGAASNPVVVNCTSTCDGTVPAAVGSDTFSVSLYDAANGGGNILSTGTLTQTIGAGLNNKVALTFNGVVASVSVVFNPVGFVSGTTGSAAVSVTAFDADGNTIVAPGVYAGGNGSPLSISLANSDNSGASSLSTNTVTGPASAVTLNYTAALATSPTITASMPGVPAAHATLQLYQAPTLTSLSTWSGIVGNTVSETLTGTNFVAGVTAVSVGGNVNGVTVSSVNVTSSTTLTASFTISGGTQFGEQDVTVKNISTASAAVPFNVATGPSLIVTSRGDSGAGSLRSAIIAANSTSGALITFSAVAGVRISSPLPPITSNVVLDGGTFGTVVLDGHGLYRAFWADSGNVIIANLQIQNALAQGGNGGGGYPTAGGGGLGAGAGLFIRAANVNLENVYFVNDVATGGTGADGITEATAGGGGGGGGGLGGAGGGGAASTGVNGGGGGGGGVTIDGLLAGPSGGDGGDGGGGGGNGGSGVDGAGGVGYAGGSAGSNASSGVGGAGGFGGGGGGGGNGAAGGTGGFGGGGGAGGSIANGAGNGGPGGGGAGGSSDFGSGGALIATLKGGSGGSCLGCGTVVTTSGGGGGAAAGPAVFLFGGSLITFNSDASTCAANGGPGGNGTGAQASSAGGADSTPVFNFGGTVNASTVKGPIASALGTSVP